jgi:hypothetical protein
MDKLILTDIDGVVLNWTEAFQAWMNGNGYPTLDDVDNYYVASWYEDMTDEQAMEMVDRFNSSNQIIGLAPHRNAVAGITRLAESGYTFHGITAMGECDYMHRLRQINLDTVFGTGVFTNLTLTPLLGSKMLPLSHYAQSGKYWIEDSVKHATLGLELGLTPMLMDHVYNKECDVVGIKRVNCWDDICDLILGTT